MPVSIQGKNRRAYSEGPATNCSRWSSATLHSSNAPLPTIDLTLGRSIIHRLNFMGQLKRATCTSLSSLFYPIGRRGPRDGNVCPAALGAKWLRPPLIRENAISRLSSRMICLRTIEDHSIALRFGERHFRSLQPKLNAFADPQSRHVDRSRQRGKGNALSSKKLVLSELWRWRQSRKRAGQRLRVELRGAV